MWAVGGVRRTGSGDSVVVGGTQVLEQDDAGQVAGGSRQEVSRCRVCGAEQVDTHRVGGVDAAGVEHRVDGADVGRVGGDGGDGGRGGGGLSVGCCQGSEGVGDGPLPLTGGNKLAGQREVAGVAPGKQPVDEAGGLLVGHCIPFRLVKRDWSAGVSRYCRGERGAERRRMRRVPACRFPSC